jgi:FkbM family methyltransferase
MVSFKIKHVKGAVEIIEAQGLGNLFRRGYRFFSSDPDLEIKNAIKQYSKNFDTFIDIGAAVGSVTFSVATNFSKCFCFEPEKRNYEEFKNKLENNGLKNIEIFNFALGKEKDEKEFFISPEGRLDNRFGIHSNENFKSYKVKINVLDDILQFQNVHEKCLIKIDVQGFEFEVMQGAKKILQEDCIIISEFWPWAMKLNGTDPLEYVEFLYSLGYGFFDIKNNIIEKQELEKLCSYTNKKFVHDDFIIKKLKK